MAERRPYRRHSELSTSSTERHFQAQRRRRMSAYPGAWKPTGVMQKPKPQPLAVHNKGRRKSEFPGVTSNGKLPSSSGETALLQPRPQNRRRMSELPGASNRRPENLIDDRGRRLTDMHRHHSLDVPTTRHSKDRGVRSTLPVLLDVDSDSRGASAALSRASITEESA